MKEIKNSRCLIEETPSIELLTDEFIREQAARVGDLAHMRMEIDELYKRVQAVEEKTNEKR